MPKGGKRAELRTRRHSRRDLTRRVEGLGLALGFDRVGVAPAQSSPRSEFVRAWIERGYAGEMHYLARNLERRLNPGRVLEGARSAVCVALRYADRGTGDEAAIQGAGRVARYARGADYHELMLERLEQLGAVLGRFVEAPVRWRAYVDTGPILERELAAAAGLGWVGKNTCLIDPELGSYFFLGVLLCDLELATSEAMTDHCGSCRACLDACPTDAFAAPQVLDASRCLAYTTIELRAAIPEALRAPQRDWVFGCDVCQEVCPWNRRERGARPPHSPLQAALEGSGEWEQPALRWLLSLDEAAWREATHGRALRRAKYRGLLRNALIAAGNSGDPALRSAVEAHCDSSDPILAEHARWAARQLGSFV